MGALLAATVVTVVGGGFVQSREDAATNDIQEASGEDNLSVTVELGDDETVTTVKGV